MKKIAYTVAGLLCVAFGPIALLAVAVLHIPAEIPGWLAEYPFDASADAREMAAALSTPPTHLRQPLQYALYHWQTLIAGALAYLGGMAAIAGAGALVYSTWKQIGEQRRAEEKKEADRRIGFQFIILEEVIRIYRQAKFAEANIYCLKEEFNVAESPQKEGAAVAALWSQLPKEVEEFNLTPDDFTALGHDDAAHVREIARRLSEFSDDASFKRELHADYDAVGAADFDELAGKVSHIANLAHVLLVALQARLKAAGVRHYIPE